ncbi:SDR family NAD(P)-dependent oxidoreductase [Metabacillus sp. RGM 3146]|uniref:SDR family NAD(P)-dependent oxidoreductase n=1 Tax=Metabacillus sp. RGM 3146 TaxID=3401092 RepID=UPI003B9C06EE
MVTGGARGIGRQACLKFAKKGDRVLVADFNEELGSETVDLIKSEGGEANFFFTDVTSMENVESLVEKAVHVYGRIDVMVNNAGVSADWDPGVNFTLGKALLQRISAVYFSFNWIIYPIHGIIYPNERGIYPSERIIYPKSAKIFPKLVKIYPNSINHKKRATPSRPFPF